MKTTGWVLFDTEEKKYVDKYYNTVTTKLSRAKIFATREEVRYHKLGCDRVRKVRIEGGRAIEIIPGR